MCTDKRTDFMISGYYNPIAKRNMTRLVLKLHNYDEERENIGYLVCDINSSAFTSIMSKYVDVEQVCLWLQPVGDQVIAKTGTGFCITEKNPETACKSGRKLLQLRSA